MSLTPGARLGHYEIVGLIGAGGMGEVYEARDPRLNRTVAIKVLLEHISNQPEARARFEREAQTIAGLNHPHISTLHDVGRHGDTDFLVMELLEGETLSKRLERGPLPLHLALQYAIEMADALAQAHRHGVTHRDLKPGNIMLTRSGVKLLDFGLAKLRRPQNVSSFSTAPTQADVTAEGSILGTLQYMAPEQLEGSEADARTDIFAFGTVLHEMVTGRKAFEGKSRMSLMGSILRDTPPPVSALQPVAPAALNRLIATCLAKEPDDRWQSARDVWRELKWIVESGATKPDVAGSRRVISVGVAASIALVAVVIAAAAAWTLKPVVFAGRSPVARVTVTLPPGDQIVDLGVPSLAISPDGSKLAYVGQHGNTRLLYVRAIDSPEANPIPGTEGGSQPFFSPDGQWIGLFAQGKLKKVPVAGGAVQTLCDAARGQGASWAAGDTIYFAPFNTSGLWKVAASGGTPQAVTTLDRSKGEVSHRWPQVLPGGRAVLFTVWTGPGWDERHLHLQMLETGERRVLAQGASTGRYVPSGHLFYSRAEAVMAVPFDLARLHVNGPPVTLADRVLDDDGATYGVSDSGMLAYVPASPRRFERRLVWVDAKGNVEPLSSPPRGYTDPAVSPDGRYAAVTTIGSKDDVWIYDLSRRTLTSLTSTSTGSSQSPTWTPDGKRILYRGTRTGFRNLFWKAVDGSGDEERLTTSEGLQTPTSWSPDGRQVVFLETSPATGSDIWVLPLDTRQPHAFLKTVANEDSPRFSPDGRWLAYSSNESGTDEVYVRPFPGPGGTLPISTEGGREPVWSRNGRELFYRQGEKMLSVSIGPQPVFTVGPARTLFEGRYSFTDTGGAGYDVSVDGRFLMVQPVEPEQAATHINVVLNWFNELKRRVPAGKP